MPATSKDELLVATRKEYDKLDALISDLSDAQAGARDSEGTSIKDVIGHRAHWIGLFLGWYADGIAGKPVFFPAPGYKWNQLKAYNAELRRSQARLSWHGAKRLLRENHDHLLELVCSLENDALYGGPMKGANNDWTPGRWAEAAGPSHYRSACKYIRQTLKSRSS